MSVTKNFGQIVGIIKGNTPPTITSVIWYDTAQVTAADSIKIYDDNTSSWVTLISAVNAAANGTNLSITPTASTISLNSSTGDDVVLPAATASNAGLMTAAQFSKLLGIEAGAKDDQSASEVPVIAISGVTGANVQAVLENLKTQIDNSSGATNLALSVDSDSVTVTSDTGTDAEILAASGVAAGVMTAAQFSKLLGIETGAEVNLAASVGANGFDIYSGKSGSALQVRKLSIGGNLTGNVQPGGEIFIDALSGNATVVETPQSFATDGTQTDFTLVTADPNPKIYLVEVGGNVQVDGYTISGLTVSFDVAPPNGTTVGIHYFTEANIAILEAKVPDFVPNQTYGADAAIKRDGSLRVLKSSITVPYSSATFVEADWDTIAGGGGGGPAIAAVYPDTDTLKLAANQANQEEGQLFEVTDATDDPTVEGTNGATKAWYKLGANKTESLSDYTKLSEEEAFSENNKSGFTEEVFNADLDFATGQFQKTRHTIAGAISFTLANAGTVNDYGNRKQYYLTADGINKPTLTADFEIFNDRYLNTAGAINRYFFEIQPNGKVLTEIINIPS